MNIEEIDILIFPKKKKARNKKTKIKKNIVELIKADSFNLTKNL